jgi:hypothetical protein
VFADAPSDFVDDSDTAATVATAVPVVVAVAEVAAAAAAAAAAVAEVAATVATVNKGLSPEEEEKETSGAKFRSAALRVDKSEGENQPVGLL